MAQTENSVTAYDVEDWKNKGRTQMSPTERESWLNEGQLLLTDYAEGIEREWELIKFYGQLLAAVADWCIVFLKAHMVRSGRMGRNLIISADGSNISRKR